MRGIVGALLLGIIGACFDAPAGAVMFSCDPDTAPACPSGYTCESDGCCHKNGSDVDANLGACKLAPSTDATSVTTAVTSESGSGSTGSTGSTDTGSGSSSSDTGSTSTESSSSESSSDSSSTSGSSSSG